MKITSMENGPNKVEGLSGYRIVRDGTEEIVERGAVFLCRCGHSENKPFCDGAHRRMGFEAPETVVELSLGAT